MPLGFLVAAALSVSAACSVETAPHQQYAPIHLQRQTPLEPACGSAILVPFNPVDRSIRRELTLAIRLDPELKDRGISFIVNGGDVRVTGLVGTEPQRQRINHLALEIPGVRSVANALRVSDHHR